MPSTMPVDSSLASLYESLKVDDPWVDPRPWESIPSQSCVLPSSCVSADSTRRRVFTDSEIISEASLVRLAMNALQGVQSAVISIEKLSVAFCTDPADRSFHQNSSLWNLSVSTHALGNALMAIGYSGCVVVLLSKFVDYFASFNLNNAPQAHRDESSTGSNMCSALRDVNKGEQPPCSLVNQAFAVAVGKVLNGYKTALDTLCPSIGLRCSSGGSRSPMDVSCGVGCLTNVVLSDISFLDVYLHTKELRTQVEALGSICKLYNGSACSPSSSLEHIIATGVAGFCNFPRSGYLLSYLYQQLQVADPAHCRLLKYLFVRSCGPYFSFIRSWIYKAEINDPYKEYVVDHAHNTVDCNAGNNLVASVQLQDGVVVPCFLKEISVPVIRAGQQLQILRKLLEYCKSASGSPSSEEILPCYDGFWSNHASDASLLIFNKVNIEALVNARNIYYCRMREKVQKFFSNLEVEPSRSDLAHFDGPASFGLRRSSFLFLAEDLESSTLVVDNASADDSSSVDELTYDLDGCESPHYSSSESILEKSELDDLVEPEKNEPSVRHTYLSALKSLSTIASNNSLLKRPVPGKAKKDFHETSLNVTTSFHVDHGLQPVFKLTHDACEATPKCSDVNQILDGPPDERMSRQF
ncbi:hypothetical protein MLD38_017207 [Melastoma candidum]|uniref:Uncharacterized protein n=1 Tax=Melastoma candidum TaxID=119954 RepID=A0ACB9QQF3_9MYRT|nr:hypothetical protein MLD38_017207 [Melastoma candidum]